MKLYNSHVFVFSSYCHRITETLKKISVQIRLIRAICVPIFCHRNTATLKIHPYKSVQSVSSVFLSIRIQSIQSSLLKKCVQIISVQIRLIRVICVPINSHKKIPCTRYYLFLNFNYIEQNLKLCKRY